MGLDGPRWVSSGAGDEHWLEVQLAALSEVSHVKLYWHAERYAPVSQVNARDRGENQRDAEKRDGEGE